MYKNLIVLQGGDDGDDNELQIPRRKKIGPSILAKVKS
jgi:hypothetical protein